MKKAVSAIFLCLVFLILLLPFSAAAAVTETPQLKNISFKNAVVTEKFSPSKHRYSLILDNEAVTPTLDSYDVEGDANLFVNYVYDNARHQTGVKVTLEFENGSLIYDFAYQNVQFKNQSSNNYLKSVMCNLGVVYPEINEDTSDYIIYIPKDLTVLDMSAATSDIGAYCDVPTQILLTSEQELDIPLVVTASNGDKRVYSFSVKRTDKSSKYFTDAIAQGKTEKLVKNEMLYQRPEFMIIIFGTVAVFVLLYVLVNVGKRYTIEIGDSDEQEFFTTTE